MLYTLVETSQTNERNQRRFYNPADATYFAVAVRRWSKNQKIKKMQFAVAPAQTIVGVDFLSVLEQRTLTNYTAT